MQPILLRRGEKVEAENRNVPDMSVFYTLASVSPKAEITPVCDSSERAGAGRAVICEEHAPRFCLPTLMRADNGRGLRSHDFNQRCPKLPESHSLFQGFLFG